MTNSKYFIQCTPFYIVTEFKDSNETILKFCVGINNEGQQVLDAGNHTCLTNEIIEHNGNMNKYVHIIYKSDVSGRFIPDTAKLEYIGFYNRPIKPFATYVEELIIKLYLVAHWNDTSSKVIISGVPEHDYLRNLYRKHPGFERIVDELIDILRSYPCWFNGNLNIPALRFLHDYDETITNSIISKISETAPLRIIDYIHASELIYPIMPKTFADDFIENNVIPVGVRELGIDDSEHLERTQKTRLLYFNSLKRSTELYKP